MRKIVVILLLLLFPLITMAQGGPPSPVPPPPPPGLPIDSGIVYLLLLGVAFGIRKVKD